MRRLLGECSCWTVNSGADIVPLVHYIKETKHPILQKKLIFLRNTYKIKHYRYLQNTTNHLDENIFGQFTNKINIFNLFLKLHLFQTCRYSIYTM